MGRRKNKKPIDSQRIPLFLGGALLLPFLFYIKSLSYPLVFDSLGRIQESLWHVYDWDIFLKFRWVSQLSLALTFSVFQDDIFWYRLGNLLVHVLNGCLLFIFFKNLNRHVLGKQSKPQQIDVNLIALIGSLFFLLNPIAIYAVAYVIQRSVLLALSFGLLSFLSLWKGLKDKRIVFLWLAAFFYYLCLESKEHAAPFILLHAFLVGLFFLKDKLQFKTILGPLVLALFALGQSVLKYKGLLGESYEPFTQQIIQNQHQLSSSLDISHVSTGWLWFLSIVNQQVQFFRYFFLWIVPYTPWISADMAFPFPINFSFVMIVAALVFVLWPVLCLFLFKKAKEWRLLALSLFFPWVLFLTELTVVRYHEPFVLYRSYLWMWAIGFALPFIFQLIRRELLWVLFGIYFVIFIYVGQERLQTFQSDAQLWADASQKLENLYDARYPEGAYRTFNNHGARLLAQNKVDEALKYFGLALKVYPQSKVAWHGMGFVYHQKKQPKKALEKLQKALSIDPQYGLALNTLGNVHMALGDLEKAKQSYKQALSLDPKYAMAHYNLGNIYLSSNQIEDALQSYQKAIDLDSDFYNAHYNIGNAYYQLGQVKLAIQHYLKALEGQPRSVDVLHNLGSCYLRLDDTKTAKEYYLKVLSINAKFKPTLKELQKINETY